MRRILALLIFLGSLFVLRIDTGHAQSSYTCPALVQRALSLVENACSAVGRNQVCYGHSVLMAEQRPEITDVLLNAPGDITEIYNINRLRLFSMDVELGQWGVAMMRVQANLPDSLPGQNVLFMLFGDVELTPISSTELADASLTEPLLEPLRAATAFRLRTGIGSPLCDTAPRDGLLVQTPHGHGRVEMTINGVDVNLGSTVFFHMSDENTLTVSTLEGSALLNAAGGESLALAGSEVSVPMNENLEPAAPPSLPQPYAPEALHALPLSSLDRPVEVHPALSSEEVAVVQQAVLEGRAAELLPEIIEVAAEPTACPGSSCAPGRRASGSREQRANTSGTFAINEEKDGPTRSGSRGNCPGNSCNSNGNGGNNPNGNGGNCPGNSCSANDNNGNSDSGNGGNNPNDNGGGCPGNSCGSNGAAGSGNNGRGNENSGN